MSGTPDPTGNPFPKTGPIHCEFPAEPVEPVEPEQDEEEDE